MATETEKESNGFSWSNAINAYRDIAIAKRNNPKAVQGVEQSQTTFAQNLSAPFSPGGSSTGGMAQNSKLAMGLGVLLLGGLVVFAMTKK